MEIDRIDSLNFSTSLVLSGYIELVAEAEKIGICVNCLCFREHAEFKHLLVALVMMTGVLVSRTKSSREKSLKLESHVPSESFHADPSFALPCFGCILCDSAMNISGWTCQWIL